ncbi:hypothetical protein BGX30_014533 [Mortierella sp. GBA39]|nr:hypothetical protein BGX30_014533 [Mortierella sp. GBA39]
MGTQQFLGGSIPEGNHQQQAVCSVIKREPFHQNAKSQNDPGFGRHGQIALQNLQDGGCHEQRDDHVQPVRVQSQLVWNLGEQRHFKWDDLKRIFGVSDVLPMWVADMDFAAPDSVISALNSRVEHGVFGYTMQSDAYNQAVADWMKSRHRWSIDKEWIVFCPGVVPALSFIVQAFTEPGDKVAIQTPVYPPFYSVVTDHGRELVQNPLKEQDGYYTMDLEALEQSLDDTVKLFILCSPHNPVGRVWRREELEAVAKLCMERGILMVSDEIHADLVYEEGTHIPFASLSEEIQENCIISTYLMWLDFRALQMSPDDLEQFLLNKAKLALNKGSAFGKEGEGFMRLNIACSRSLVEEAMKRLDQAVQEWRKEQQQQQQQPV